MPGHPLNLDDPLQKQIFLVRQELESLRGWLADLHHALTHDDLEERAMMENLARSLEEEVAALSGKLTALEARLAR